MDSTTQRILAPSSLRPRCWLEVDLAALERNVGRVRAMLPAGVRYVSIVKADAYGCGLPQVGRLLLQCGVDAFGVANVGEGVLLRELGAQSKILVMGPLVPEEDRYLLDYGLTPTLSCLEEVQRFSAVALAAGRVLDVHIKVDTGMGRTGCWYESLSDLYRALESATNIRVIGLYTHMALAGQDDAYTQLQRSRLLEVFSCRPHFMRQAPLWLHADISGSLHHLKAHEPFNAVRIGLLQYGVSPSSSSPLSVPVEPIFSFYARVGFVKTLPAGAAIGYGLTHVLTRPSRTAVITLGYADGLPTTRQNCGYVLIRGRRCPILGRVSMDQTVVDVTDCPEASCGDIAVLIGSQGAESIDLNTYGAWCGRIAWEALTSVSKRVVRTYRSHRA